MKKRKKRSFWYALLFLILGIGATLALVTGVMGSVERYRTEQQKKAYPIPAELADAIACNSAEFEIPREVILGIIRTESGFDANAISSAGARGLMQLMPDTFTWLARLMGETVEEEDITVPEVNLRFGCYFLRRLYDEFGNWNTVYAAYNAGFNRVRQWLADERYAKDGVLVHIPIGETENYVKKVDAAVQTYRSLYFAPES